jgi:energy-coupling factor transporter transmembrane protein EcfT
LLLTLLASRLLGLERWAPFALGLFALRMRALLLRLFVAGRFLTPLLAALLLTSRAAAVARSVGLRRLRLPLALPALLHRPVLAFATRALALAALVATAARAVGRRWPRDFRRGRCLNRLAFEPAE